MFSPIGFGRREGILNFDLRFLIEEPTGSRRGLCTTGPYSSTDGPELQLSPRNLALRYGVQQLGFGRGSSWEVKKWPDLVGFGRI